MLGPTWEANTQTALSGSEPQKTSCENCSITSSPRIPSNSCPDLPSPRLPLSCCAPPPKGLSPPETKDHGPGNLSGCKELSASPWGGGRSVTNLCQLNVLLPYWHYSGRGSSYASCCTPLGHWKPKVHMPQRCGAPATLLFQEPLRELCLLVSAPPTCPLAIWGLWQLPNPSNGPKVKAIGSTSGLKRLSTIRLIWPRYCQK